MIIAVNMRKFLVWANTKKQKVKARLNRVLVVDFQSVLLQEVKMQFVVIVDLKIPVVNNKTHNLILLASFR